MLQPFGEGWRGRGSLPSSGAAHLHFVIQAYAQCAHLYLKCVQFRIEYYKATNGQDKKDKDNEEKFYMAFESCFVH